MAVLTFMAQIGQCNTARDRAGGPLLKALFTSGSYIPAEAALIGLTDRILTRISTKESISRV